MLGVYDFMDLDLCYWTLYELIWIAMRPLDLLGPI